MNELYLIVGMVIVTFLVRYGLLGFSKRVNLSTSIMQMLRYIPPAVLTAIIVPTVLVSNGNQLLLNHTNARLVGAIVAILVSYSTKNLLLTITIGMATFFAWQWLLK